MNASLPAIIFYEPRLLQRYGVGALLTRQGYPVLYCSTLEQFTKAICSQDALSKTVLLGVGGLGRALPQALRTLQLVSTLKIPLFAYISQSEPLLTRLFTGLGAKLVLPEDELESRLPDELRKPLSRKRRHGVMDKSPFSPRISVSELNVMLDFLAGLQTRQIAVRQGCSYKTVFTHKRNACLHLNINSRSDWVDLLINLNRIEKLHF